MSSSRSRNKFCLSLDDLSSSTSSNTTHLNRWSEVVPPKTALTFAALWDPEEGMVTFSGAALLESESVSGTPPHSDVFDNDGHSQFISVDRDSDEGSTTSEDTATLATFQDAFKAFIHRTPWNSKEHLHAFKAGQGMSRCLQARASSTFDGLDVYSHDIQTRPRRSLQLSCSDLLDIESSFRTPSAFGILRLRSDLMLDSCRPESGESASSAGSRPSYLKSRFSTTTTSTSNYVDVTASALQSARTSEASPIPEACTNACVSPANSWPSLPQEKRRRLLRKRRPLDSVAISSATSSPPSTPRKITSKASMSPSTSPSSTTAATVSPSRTASARGEALRGRFPRPIGTGALITSTPVAPPTPPPTPPVTATPPATPSPSKSPRLKLRFTLLPRRKSRRTCPDSDGWVFIEVTPIIRQRYMADLDQD